MTAPLTAERISFVDTHTGGEPTRVVVDCPFDLGSGNLRQRLLNFRDHFDHYRRCIVREPRGSEVVVGAVLTEPDQAGSHCGVIFFNNTGYLGMCGHGTIGLAVALHYLERLRPGEHSIDTAVGTVSLSLHDAHQVSVRNVPSYRYRSGVAVEIGDGRQVYGDVAWGGNWFFICENHGLPLEFSNLPSLEKLAWQIRKYLEHHGITGQEGAAIDHIALYGPPTDSQAADAKSFVLCPGGAYDRSPCGTGTSARLACLAAAGKLAPGQPYRQEGMLGSVFSGHYDLDDRSRILPTICGAAFVIAEGHQILDPLDPIRNGVELSDERPPWYTTRAWPGRK